MAMLMQIAWRNIWRHKRRTLITVGAMAVGVGLSMAMIAFMDGMYLQGFDLMVSQNLGHVQIHQPKYPSERSIYDTIEDSDELVTKLEGLPDAHAVTQRVFGYALLGTDERPDRPQKANGAQLVGVDPMREGAISHIGEKVKAGHYLSEKPAHEVVLGFGLAEALLADVGDEIAVVTQASDGSIGNDLYTVVGITHTGSVIQDRSGAFVHISDLRDLLVLGDVAHEIALVAPDKDRVDALLSETEAAVEGRDLLVQPWQKIDPMMVQFLSLQDAGNWIILLMVFSVAALGILNTMLMSVFERTKELGVIRALGLGPGHLVLLVMYETLALVLVSGAAGAVLGLALDAWLCTSGLDFSVFFTAESYSFGGIDFPTYIYGDFRAAPLFQTLVGLLLISFFAAIWPAIRAARLQPVEAMRQE